MYRAFKGPYSYLFDKNSTKCIPSGLCNLESEGEALVHSQIVDQIVNSDSNHVYTIVLPRKYNQLPVIFKR